MQRTSEGELAMTNQSYYDRPLHELLKSKTESKVAQTNIPSIKWTITYFLKAKIRQQWFVSFMIKHNSEL